MFRREWPEGHRLERREESAEDLRAEAFRPMPTSKGGPRGERGCEGEGSEDRFISTAGRHSNRERRTRTLRPNQRRQYHSSPNSIHRATAAATIEGYHVSSEDNPMVINGGIYVHGWQPSPPFLNCSERSLRSRPPKFLDHNDTRPTTKRPALLGSFVPHAFQQLEPRAGGITHGAVRNFAEQHVVECCHHNHRQLQQQQQQQQRETYVDSNGSCETFSSPAEFCSTPHHLIGGYAQEGADKTMNLTENMVSLATDSAASATTPLTGQRNVSSDCSERNHSISTWWTGYIEQAVVFASAYRAHSLDGRDGRRVETHLAALLANTILDAACQNVYCHDIEQRRRQSNPPRETDAPPALLPNPQTSDEGGEEEIPVLSQGAPEDPSRFSFAREFVAEVMRAGFLEAVPVAVAAGRCPTVPLAVVEDQDKPPVAVSATTPQVDETSHIMEKGVEEQQHQQQQAEVHDGYDRRCSDATSNDGAATAKQIPSPTPQTVITVGCEDNTRPSGLQVVPLPASLLHDGRSQTGSAAPATGISVGQCTRSSPAATTRNPEERRYRPPSSRKRFRNGTFVRITNVPVKSNTAVGHALRLDTANHDGKQGPREGARCWRPSMVSQQSSRHEASATATEEQRPRPRPAVLQEVHAVGVGGSSVSPVAPRTPDMAVKRKAKSAGAARSAAGVGVGGRNGSRGGARLQLRRNRWCSPTAVVGDGGCLDLEGSVSSLRTTFSSSGGGGCGNSRETFPCPTVDGDTQKASIVDATTPRRPNPRVQAHHISDAHGRVGRGTVTNISGVEDGAWSGTTRIYGVAIGGEGVGGAKQVTGEAAINLSSTSSFERVFPPMSYEYKHLVKGLGPQDRTGLYTTAAAAVTAAAAAAVATASAATEQSEREAFAWRNCSNSSRAEGAQSRGGSVVSHENVSRGSWETLSGGPGGLRMAPPPKPPIGMKQAPLANPRRPGRTFALRP